MARLDSGVEGTGRAVQPLQRVKSGQCGRQRMAKLEKLEQVLFGADEQPLALHLRQSPEQELPEAPPLLDLAEHGFHGGHAQGIPRLPRRVRNLCRIRSQEERPVDMRPLGRAGATALWRVSCPPRCKDQPPGQRAPARPGPSSSPHPRILPGALPRGCGCSP